MERDLAQEKAEFDATAKKLLEDDEFITALSEKLKEKELLTAWMNEVVFEIISQISSIETIAVGTSIREIKILREQFGRGRWRKLKGIAQVKLQNGRIRLAELHWYEAHGIGKRKMKIKTFLD